MIYLFIIFFYDTKNSCLTASRTLLRSQELRRVIPHFLPSPLSHYTPISHYTPKIGCHSRMKLTKMSTPPRLAQRRQSGGVRGGVKKWPRCTINNTYSNYATARGPISYRKNHKKSFNISIINRITH